MKLLFFDVETTGLNSATCAIHQLAGIIEIDGEIKESFSLLIKPHEDAEISDDALQVTGLNRKILSLHPSAASQHVAFVRTLSKYVNKYDKADKFYLAGFNSRAFDEPFLRAFWGRHDAYYGSYFWQIGFDVMVLAAEYLKHDLPTMPNFKLATVAAHLGIRVDAARLHDAMYDVELTRAIYCAIQSPIDATQLAKQVLETLDAQQRYFQAARTGSALKIQALERSKELEKALRVSCTQLLKPSPQPTLF